MIKKVLICDRFAMEATVHLRKIPDLQIVLAQTPEHLSSELATAQGLLIRSKQKINAAFLNEAPKLEVIVTCTSGFDHIDLTETKKRNIAVMFTPEANQISAAELTWGLLLACARHIPQAHKDLKSRTWNREPYLGFELAGKTLGIVGLGRIGTRVAAMGKAFGMTLLAFDPYCDDSAFSISGAERCSYDELLKQSDAITFHVPGTKETTHMLNRIHFEMLSPTAVIVNTSRGAVIHEDDLADALFENKIKAAALDVFGREPLDKNSKLFKCSNAILTPHLGAYTEEAFFKASMQGALQIENFFKSKKLENSLPLINQWGSLSFQEGN
ncbi:MAG: hypothetical protein A2622_01405 [Bdellovibrionales bacterium RIFCSPHIGHO2_01_FULL_40_29]|nr:MAG: hypothetical protein A2622_01405 [Bdellovibrionales bacterium RIFCSPHIGHO2_01_FULL_40_29]OFZ32764.1 MAG: hypothetical protein A3D17_06005 [Bdellovibrionales bacterium RIFCSPHIGHO2_02_FULL_40_15]